MLRSHFFSIKRAVGFDEKTPCNIVRVRPPTPYKCVGRSWGTWKDRQTGKKFPCRRHCNVYVRLVVVVFSNDYGQIKTILPTPPSPVRQSAPIRQPYPLLCEFFFFNNFLKKIRTPWTLRRHNNTMMWDIRVCGKRLDHGTNVFLAAAYWDFCSFFFFLKKRYVRVSMVVRQGWPYSSIDETLVRTVYQCRNGLYTTRVSRVCVWYER